MLSCCVDLRPKNKRKFSHYHTMARRRCGCVCLTCHKRMYRSVAFLLLFDQEMPRGVERDNLVKGKASDIRCQCGGDVLFTHCSERS